MRRLWGPRSGARADVGCAGGSELPFASGLRSSAFRCPAPWTGRMVVSPARSGSGEARSNSSGAAPRIAGGGGTSPSPAGMATMPSQDGHRPFLPAQVLGTRTACPQCVHRKWIIGHFGCVPRPFPPARRDPPWPPTPAHRSPLIRPIYAAQPDRTRQIRLLPGRPGSVEPRPRSPMPGWRAPSAPGLCASGAAAWQRPARAPRPGTPPAGHPARPVPSGPPEAGR